MFAAAALAALVQPSAAQQYPNQIVRIVVPFSAGSNTDAQARVLADKLSQMWKQQVIVENRPGIAGTASVAKSAPDGYTLMLTSSGHPVANVISPAAPFDPVKDFAGVTQVSAVSAAFVVPPELPGEQSEGVHRAGAEVAGQAEFRLGGDRQHVLSRGRDLQAGRQGQPRAHSLQGRARGVEQHPAQRRAGLFCAAPPFRPT